MQNNGKEWYSESTFTVFPASRLVYLTRKDKGCLQLATAAVKHGGGSVIGSQKSLRNIPIATNVHRRHPLIMFPHTASMKAKCAWPLSL